MRTLGKHDEAHAHHEKAMEIRHASLGSDHHHTADSYHGLGVIKSLLGSHQEAEDLHHKALNIRINKYGEDHHHTSHSFHELGIIKHLKGDAAHAMELLKKALHIRRNTFGHDHSHTQNTHAYHQTHFYDFILDTHLDTSVVSKFKKMSGKAVAHLKNLFQK